MLSNPLHLAIVDDHALFRKTLKNFLSGQLDMNIAIEATDMLELLHKLKNVHVEVLLMDLFMPGLSGNDAVKAVRTEYPGIKILAMSMSHDMDLISDLIDSGIHGFISKSDEPEDLVKAIYIVSEDRIYHNRTLTDALYWNRQNKIAHHSTASLVRLNEREKKILKLIWEEKSNKDIADELFLGVRSVEKIRQDLKEKLGVKSTVGLLKFALNKRIIGMHSSCSDLDAEFRNNRNQFW